MKTTPFISIVTVVYNGEKTIRKTIESVLCQSFKDYEYIIVDGLSKDNTLSIAKEYEERFEGRLRIYSERDKGIYDAMNKGIKHAKGDYIWLVNADDWMEPDALNDIYNYCKSEGFPTCVLSSCMNIIDAENGHIKHSTHGGDIKSYQKSCKKLGMGICHPATIVHKDVYNNIGAYDDRYYISADIDFSLRCYENKVDVRFLPTIITNMTDGGISNAFPIKKNIHDANLRAKKFSKGKLHYLTFMMWYILRLFVLKFRGYKY